eukprot:GCRY01000248.1.p1 GENE.GCRY01000248.1~~GCRY01000248.1.p1  ORF type:complete len:478 (-),score=105.76 GCRY01000248.1:135-1568(-)
MKGFLLACLLALAVGALAVPKWPSQFTVSLTSHHPYARVAMDTQIMGDNDNGYFLLSFYDSLDYYLWRDAQLYYIFVAEDHQECQVQDWEWDEQVPNQIQNILIPFEMMTFVNKTLHAGVLCDHYQYEYKNLMTEDFYLFMKEDGTFTPIQSVKSGLISAYNNFHHFESKVNSTFEIPSICEQATPMKVPLPNHLNPLPQLHPDFEHLIQAHPADSSYTVGPNQFTHMSFEEFRSQRLMPKGLIMNSDLSATRIFTSSGPVAEEIDWRQKGVVSKIQDQGECGSCWAFSSIASIESAYAIKHGNLIKGSEQYLMDCTWTAGNNGCDGGLALASFQFLQDNGGAVPLSVYPYRMEDDYCKHKNGTDTFAYVTNHTVCPSGDEACMRQLLQHGPVSVAIAVDPSLTAYHSGVYDGPCSSDPLELDHEVNVVGYTKINGEDVWIVRNSWAPVWGDNGYAYFKMGKNLCGIAIQAVLPMVL